MPLLTAPTPLLSDDSKHGTHGSKERPSPTSGESDMFPDRSEQCAIQTRNQVNCGLFKPAAHRIPVDRVVIQSGKSPNSSLQHLNDFIEPSPSTKCLVPADLSTSFQALTPYELETTQQMERPGNPVARCLLQEEERIHALSIPILDEDQDIENEQCRHEAVIVDSKLVDDEAPVPMEAHFVMSSFHSSFVPFQRYS